MQYLANLLWVAVILSILCILVILIQNLSKGAW